MPWVEKSTNGKSIVADLANILVLNGWSLEESINDDKKVLSTTYTDVEDGDLKVFVMISRQTVPNTYRYIELQAATAYTPGSGAFANSDNPGPKIKLSWANTHIVGMTDETPVEIFGNFTPKYAAFILQGDPTLDFNNYRISFAYMGHVLPFSAPGVTPAKDFIGNFAITGASEEYPSAQTNLYGDKAADGSNDIAMLRTKSGLLWQTHSVAFTTQLSTFAKDSNGFNPSRWTDRFHLSKVAVIHGYDGYRGYLDGVVVLDKNAIVHRDQLIVDTGVDDGAGGTIKDTYVYFNNKSTYSFLKQSANVNYGIAIKKA